MTWAPTYVTSEELAAFVRIGDNADDVQLNLAVAAASRAVDRATGRQFGQTAGAELRYFSATHEARSRCWVVELDDLAVMPTVVTADGAVTIDYTMRERNAPSKGLPWTSMVLGGSPGWTDVEVTARWGWSAVPETVKEATLLQASRLLARRNSPYGVTGSPDQGGELRLLAQVDPDVALILRPFVRQWWVA